MSTGLDCRIYEKTAGKWFYDLETYHRGEYDTEGPFPTYKAATDHLHRNHANPGGYSVTALPGCKHDLARPVEHRLPGENYTHSCDRCGGHIDKRDSNEQRTEAWKNVLDRETANLILSTLAEKGLTKAQAKALEALGVSEENIKKALDRAAYWWKGVQTRLDWPEAAKKIVDALTAALTDAPLVLLPDAHYGYLTFQYRQRKFGPDIRKEIDPAVQNIRAIGQQFAVEIDWYSEKINVRAR